MISRVPIVDAVVHAYNWSPENESSPLSSEFTHGNWGFHKTFSPPAYVVGEEQFVHDWSVEELAELLFVEAGADFGIYHALPLTDFYKDGLSSVERGVEWVRRFPERTRWYATVNPFEGTRALEDLERQVGLGAVGLKLYPARYVDGRTVSFDLSDEKLVYPLIERAAQLGVKVISIHKFIPFGPVATAPFGPNDLDEACTNFPNLTFEVVHVGWSFLDDSCSQLARHPNMYANLEGVFYLILKQPRRFAEALGQLLLWAGPERLLFGSGASLVHPRPAIEAFLNFQMPDDLVEGFGYPEVTDEIRALILGGNAARLHSLDLSRVIALDDEVAAWRAASDPDSLWRAVAAS